MSKRSAITVTRLVRRMRNLLEVELGEIWVEGEISNLRRQSSDHVYFTLKDDGGQISAVLFRGNARKTKTNVKEGMQVRVFGEVSLYEARGSVQLIIRQIEEDGQGVLQARFEALKEKLKEEGLFEQSKKRPLPTHPLSLGLITSGTSAALQDMLNILSRRAPWIQAYLYDVTVQGKGAERRIAQAINEWSEPEQYQLPSVDVLIIGRGGGSLEDLWNFNEEVVARAIAACSIPVISAVGHEIDFTIADFVADMRAPTPSAAIELLSADRDELLQRIEALKQSLDRGLNNRLENLQLRLMQAKRGSLSQSSDRLLREPVQRLEQSYLELCQAAEAWLQLQQNKLDRIGVRLEQFHVSNIVQRQTECLSNLTLQLERAVHLQISQRAAELSHYGKLLKTLGPESAFQRGFTITMNAKGQAIKDLNLLSEGDQIITHTKGGHFQSTINDLSEVKDKGS